MPFNFYFQQGELWDFYIFGFMVIVAIFFNIYMKYWWWKNAEEMKNFKSSLEGACIDHDIPSPELVCLS